MRGRQPDRVVKRVSRELQGVDGIRDDYGSALKKSCCGVRVTVRKRAGVVTNGATRGIYQGFDRMIGCCWISCIGEREAGRKKKMEAEQTHI